MAKTISNALNNPIFKLYLEFMAYNLHLINGLNIEFQSEKPKTPILLERISFLYKSILKCFIKRQMVEVENVNVFSPNNYLDINQIYFGGKVDTFLKNPDTANTVSANDLHNFKMHCLQFYIELCVQLKKRFDLKDEHLIYASTFVPKKAISGEILSISQFTYLFPYLSVDVDKVNLEWQLISETESLKKFKDADLTLFWENISVTKNELGKPMFSNLMQVVKCVLSLPHSCAAVERIFSQLTLKKISFEID